MKHIKTFESFLNENTGNSIAEWDAPGSLIAIIGGIGGDAGIRCNNGKLEAYFDGPRGSYSNSLGISCDQRDWETVGPDIANELTNSGMWLGGLVSRPIDAEAKKTATTIIKNMIK